ncbi:ABC transporter ATP-binding protein [Minwuia sp.]|uniref:ABC transporter ATP-binding protein n=1 Tax=Minwuia sp. TaxID=2493630 RepID=UPI003A8E6418
MTGVLAIERIGKSYGKHVALEDVSLGAGVGERIALLGHNGAGKSTLMKLVLGLSQPSSGRISVLGSLPGTDVARSVTAYLPESVSFHRSLTGREQLGLFSRLAGTPDSDVADLLDRVGLKDAADRRIGTWSKGMRQRLGLAQVLLGCPKLALLDEPASGLDPISRAELYGIIDEMAAKGTTVLIASHALTEVEARTDRIAILNRGRLIADDSLSNLRKQAGLPIRITVTTTGDTAGEIHLKMGGRRINGASLELTCEPARKMATLARITSFADRVSDIEMHEPSLEEVYRHYSGDALT